MFSFREVGSSGCEVLRDGEVVAWTVNEPWASLIVGLLNVREMWAGQSKSNSLSDVDENNSTERTAADVLKEALEKYDLEESDVGELIVTFWNVWPFLESMDNQLLVQDFETFIRDNFDSVHRAGLFSGLRE